MDAIRKSIQALRDDAIERGLTDLAIVYGWSAIRLGEHVLGAKMIALGFRKH